MRISTWFIGALISFTTGVVGAQEHEVHAHEPEKKNEIGIFAGLLSNLEAKQTGPSIGADYTRELTHVIGIGVMGEFAKAGEREALVAGTFVLKAGENFKVVFAPGVILEKHEEGHSEESSHGETSSEATSREVRFVARIGAGHSYELSGTVLTPSSISISSRDWKTPWTLTWSTL